MSWFPSSRDGGARRAGVVTVLDIGSSKVCCIIARLQPRQDSRLLPGRTHQIQVLGIGHQKSLGVKSGVIVDLDRSEEHTSELQSRENLVCRLLLEKNNK